MALSRRRAIVVAMALAACVVGGVFARRARLRVLETEAIRRNNLAVGLLEEGWFNTRIGEAVVSELEGALRCRPDYGLARINLGIAHYYRMLRGWPPVGSMNALELLQPLLATEPYNPWARFLTGSILLGEGRHRQALEHFEAVRQIDPSDMHTLYLLATCLRELGRYDAAIRALQELTERYPRHSSAHYYLSQLYSQDGRREDGQSALRKLHEVTGSTDWLFQLLGPRIRTPREFSEKYLTPIFDSRGLSPRFDPPLRYVDVTREHGLVFKHSGPAPGGDVERAIAGEPLPREWFAEPENQHALAPRVSTGCACGDWNGDSRLDFLLADSAGKHALFEQGADGRFTDVTARSGFKTDLATATACAFADLDDDGFLDVVLAGQGGVRVLRHTGGTLAGVTLTWGFRDAASPLDAHTALAIADPDHDGDLDVFAAGGVVAEQVTSLQETPRFPDDFAPQPNRLFRNNRNGTFSEVGATAGVADAKDDGRFVRAVLFADLDDDIAVDLVTVDWRGEPRVFLSQKDGSFARATLVAGSKLDITVLALLPGLLPPGESRSFGDFDQDGGVDRLTLRCGRPAVLERCASVPEHWLTVRLRVAPNEPKFGQSNRFGIGSKVETRWTGSWQTKELRLGNGQGGCDAPELVFDLGREERIDFARARFPSAARKSQTDIGSRQVITLEEPDFARGSCPAVFAWNDERFEFITDTISAGVFGELTGPNTYWPPDPDEWLRIEAAQLRERDGAFELRFANALEEVTYLDRSRLLAVEHPEGLEVYPDERMALDPQTRRPARVLVVHGLRAIVRATDHRRRNVTKSLETIDREVFDDFELLPFEGFAEDWSLTLELALEPDGKAGDVVPLLHQAEGAFVVMGHGDEVALRFSTSSLPAQAPGTRRTWLFFSHGYEKGFDFRAPITQAVEPLPVGPEARIEAQLELGYPFEWNTRPSLARPLLEAR